MAENAPWAGLVYLGDVLDLGCISSHNEANLRAVEGQRILKDYKICDAKILQPHEQIIRKSNPKARIVWISGNHEFRATRWLSFNTQAIGMFEPEIVLKLKERNIEWIDFWEKGEVFKIGKATFGHGKYCNEGHAKKHALRYSVPYGSFPYGHTHDTNCCVVPGANNKTIIAQSLGHLSKMPKWMQGSPSNWEQAFAVFEFMPDGQYNYSVIRIKNHRFVFNGVVYD
jgi:hypothetical protein